MSDVRVISISVPGERCSSDRESKFYLRDFCLLAFRIDAGHYASFSRVANNGAGECWHELDSFVAAGILNRMKPKGWGAYITSPTEQVTSMSGVIVTRRRHLSFATEADAVLIGSGVRTREISADAQLLAQLRLDPRRQLIGAQCSGTLLLAKLGLVGDLPACTDLTTRPWVIEAGVRVIDAPFVANGNVATAGGCLSSHYLAAWMIARGATWQDAAAAVHYVAPDGEKEQWIERV